jgi:hypothetical protein
MASEQACSPVLSLPSTFRQVYPGTAPLLCREMEHTPAFGPRRSPSPAAQVLPQVNQAGELRL